MKILLIFTLCLVSGPVTCSDVIGYSGGSVIIISNINWYTHDSKYICKMKENDCSDIIRADTKRHQVQDGRFMLYSNTNNLFLVMIRKLKPQDAGTYRFGLGNQNNSTVNLKVHNNASCGVPKLMNAYLGQNITITCKYPGEYEKNYKYIYSVNDDNFLKVILNTDKKFQNGRFSISDNKSVKVLSVNISNVTEIDEVFYLPGIWNGEGTVRYYTFFAEIQLHNKGSSTTIQPTTTGSNMMTSSSQTEIQSTMCFSSSAFISVCVCAALLLIGGFALMIYKLRRQKTQDYAASSKSENNKPLPSVSHCLAALIKKLFSLRVLLGMLLYPPTLQRAAGRILASPSASFPHSKTLKNFISLECFVMMLLMWTHMK